MLRIAFVLFVIACAHGALSLSVNSNPETRIIGGSSAEKASIPYVVSVQSNGEHKCGGSIINERTILTAAYCLQNETPCRVKVLAGSKTATSCNTDGQLIPAKALHSHEKYEDFGLDYDIALVRLERPLQFNAAVQPVALPANGEKIIDGIYGTISGWGVTNLKDNKRSEILQYAIVPVWEQEDCNRLLGHINEITNRMVCAGFPKGGVDSCDLDAGGPFVSLGKLIGVVSWGEKCAKPNRPGVYSRVSAYVPWIKKVLKNKYKETI